MLGPGNKIKGHMLCMDSALLLRVYTARIVALRSKGVCVCVFAFNNETRLIPFCLFERLRSHTPPGRREPREPSDTQPPRRVSLTTQEQRLHSITVSYFISGR